MKHGCPEPEDLLAGYDTDGEDGPLRAHVAGCARCRALVAARDCFLHCDEATAADPEEAARLADADRRLAEAIAGAAGPVVTGNHAGGGERRAARHFTRNAFRAWPAALAAAVVASVGIWLVTSGPETGAPGGGPAPREQTWRGAGEHRLPTPAPEASHLPDGGLHLGWRRVSGADRYTVTLLDGDLATLADLDAGDATGLDLPADAVPARVRGGFFVVTAYSGDRELGRWTPAPLP